MANVELIQEVNYVQSANTLFHFMKEEEYLLSALDKRALFPRYCIENIDYIGIKIEGKPINQVAVLQKCFCDIPLHQLTKPFSLEVDKDDFDATNLNTQNDFGNTHPDFYGKYAIAFSKKWCTSQNLQPVHYINSQASYIKDFRQTFEYVASFENIDDIIANDIINRLIYFKPLSGKMSRSKKGKTINYIKNFHDEREWRYIPSIDKLNKKNLEPIIYKEFIIKELSDINSSIASEPYLDIALKFEFDDIKYLLVPTDKEKNRLLKHIINMPNNNEEKLKLASRILVLEEIEKDW